MQRLVIYGAGGFGAELLTAARAETREIVFAADRPTLPIFGKQVIAPDEITDEDEVVIGIADSATRKAIAARPYRFGKIIAPSAIIGPGVEIGEGAIFCDFSMVTARARIGRHFHCNIYSYVAHDCLVGDFVTFGPQVGCNGNVHIGDGAHLGAGATIRNGTATSALTIGENAFVAMGANVVRSVPPNVLVAGNPARLLREREVRAA